MQKGSKKMKDVKPPDKLSDLITLALNDLELVEKDPKYKVNMDVWHDVEDGEKWNDLFNVLNLIQYYNFDDAIIDFYDDAPEELENFELYVTREIDCVPYFADPTQFKKNMRFVAEQLKERGF